MGLPITQYANHSVIFIVTTLFSIIAFVSTIFIKIQKVDMGVKRSAPVKSGFHLSDYFEKTTMPIAILMCIFGFAYSSILSFMSSFAVEINLVDAASFFFVMYAAFLLISRPFTGKLFDLKGENKVIYPSILLFVIGLVILSQVQHGIVLLIVGAVIGVGFGTFQSSAQTVAVNLAPRNRVGLATSTFFVFYDLGIGVGPFVLGFVLPFTGFRAMYVGMAMIAFIGIFIYYLAHGKNNSPSQTKFRRRHT